MSWMASLTEGSSERTASFMATCLEESMPKARRTRTFALPMKTPERRHVWDLELLGTTSDP